MKWIDVNERMPEPNEDVLIYQDFSEWNRKGRIIQARCYFTEGTQEYGGPNSLTGRGYLTGYFFAVPAICHPKTVTHWMPMPEPPAIEMRKGSPQDRSEAEPVAARAEGIAQEEALREFNSKDNCVVEALKK